MLHWTAFLTLDAIVLYAAMAWRVGQERGRSGIQAPAMTGSPEFERATRVQMNTLEWMPLFLLPLWMTAYYVADWFAAMVGVVWVAGRFLYMRDYMLDPKTRGRGFLIQASAVGVLFIAALLGVARTFL